MVADGLSAGTRTLASSVVGDTMGSNIFSRSLILSISVLMLSVDSVILIWMLFVMASVERNFG